MNQTISRTARAVAKNGFKTLGSALAAGFLLASAGMATPIGNLNFANVTNGGVTVSATRLDFFPPVNPVGSAAGVGDFSTSGGTSISYSGGTITATSNPYGQIKDVDFAPGVSVPNFIQFYTSASLPTPPGTGATLPFPVFDLVSVIPGGSTQGALNNCAGVTAIGVSCSPLVTVGGTTFVSPFILTQRAGETDVTLGLNLLARDATGSTAFIGGFTTQFAGNTFNPDAIQRIINSGGSVTSSYSASFTGSAVPEPATMSMLGAGLLLVGFAGRRFRRE